MNEEWKEIEGFLVSSCGNIKRIDETIFTQKSKTGKDYYRKTGKDYLTITKTSHGYSSVSLLRRRYYIHRLIAIAFIPNPLNLRTVNHKNENKSDNRIENLEWMSIGDNSRYSLKGKERLDMKGKIPWNKGIKQKNYIR